MAFVYQAQRFKEKEIDEWDIEENKLELSLKKAFAPFNSSVKKFEAKWDALNQE